MKYTFLVAALFAFSLTVHAQSDDTAAAAPAAAAEPQVMEAQDQTGKVEETITQSKETVTETPATKVETTTSSSTTTAAKSGKPIVTQDLKGEIEKIDAEARTFTVAGKSFKLWSTGKVFFKRKLKSLADLKVGDKVAVTYREKSDGTLEASRINK